MTTLAGSGDAGYADDVGSQASFGGVSSLFWDVGSMSLFLSDGAFIRTVEPSGRVRTVFGMQGGVISGDAGVVFNGAAGTVVNASGTIFSGSGDTVYAISSAGMLSVFAGNGMGGNVDGRGTAAEFNGPGVSSFDHLGNLWVADSGDGSLRKITPDATVSTLVSGLSEIFFLAIDAADNLYVGEIANHRVLKFTPDGTQTTLAGSGLNFYKDGPSATASFIQLGQLAVDASGTVYVTDTGANCIRQIAPDGTTTTLAGNGDAPPGYVDGTTGVSGTARFNQPNGLALDGLGNLYVSDFGNLRIRVIHM